MSKRADQARIALLEHELFDAPLTGEGTRYSTSKTVGRDWKTGAVVGFAALLATVFIGGLVYFGMGADSDRLHKQESAVRAACPVSADHLIPILRDALYGQRAELVRSWTAACIQRGELP